MYLGLTWCYPSLLCALAGYPEDRVNRWLLSWGGGTQQFWIQRRYLELITVSGVYSALTDVPIAHSESACRPQGGGYALCIETLHGASWSLPEPTVAGDPEDSEHKAFLSSLFPGQGPMHMAMAKAGSL